MVGVPEIMQPEEILNPVGKLGFDEHEATVPPVFVTTAVVIALLTTVEIEPP